MKCTNCNAEIMDNAKFCQECGAKVLNELLCKDCGATLSDNCSFCTNCGSAINEQKHLTSPQKMELIEKRSNKNVSEKLNIGAIANTIQDMNSSLNMNAESITKTLEDCNSTLDKIKPLFSVEDLAHPIVDTDGDLLLVESEGDEEEGLGFLLAACIAVCKACDQATDKLFPKK